LNVVAFPRFCAALICFWVSVFAPCVNAQGASAEQVFHTIESSVYQIKIIENHSASQVTLGTGFLVDDGLIATNYHVVSNVVMEPDKHKAQITLDEQSAG